MKVEEILKNKHEKRQRGSGGRFQRGIGRSHGEGRRFNSSMLDKGKFEWKNDDKDKTEWKGGSS